MTQKSLRRPVRDSILVEIEYLREHVRAVRYAILSLTGQRVVVGFILFTDILSLTGQQVIAGFVLSTDIVSLTGHLCQSVIFIEEII